MTAKTWISPSGNMLDGSNWSPTGVPGSADTATQTSGQSYLYGAAFPTTLDFGGFNGTPPILNVYGGTANVQFGGMGPFGQDTGTINASGNSTVNVTGAASGYGAGNLTVNIGGWDNMTGSLNLAGSPSGGTQVTVDGGSSTYTHLGASTLQTNDTVTLNTNTIGAGSWTLDPLSALSVNGYFTQDVTTEGGVLLLNQPDLFAGSVDLAATGSGQTEAINMQGLFATAANYDGNTLSLDYGAQTIDQLKLASGVSFDVYQTQSGVQVTPTDPPFKPSGATLLLHV